MRSEEEVRNRLETVKEDVDNTEKPAKVIVGVGEIETLKWVLEED